MSKYFYNVATLFVITSARNPIYSRIFLNKHHIFWNILAINPTYFGIFVCTKVLISLVLKRRFRILNFFSFSKFALIWECLSFFICATRCHTVTFCDQNLMTENVTFTSLSFFICVKKSDWHFLWSEMY